MLTVLTISTKGRPLRGHVMVGPYNGSGPSAQCYKALFVLYHSIFLSATNASETDEKRDSKRSSISSKSSKSSKESVFERTWFGEIKRAFTPWDPEEFEGESKIT